MYLHYLCRYWALIERILIFRIDNTKGKHEIYHKYFDKNLPEKKPLSVFISGNYYLIKNLIENRNYNQVYYIGVSGGGWFVTLLSSFITEIKIAIHLHRWYHLSLDISELEEIGKQVKQSFIRTLIIMIYLI